MSDPRTIAVYDARRDDYAAMMDREARQDPIISHFIAACPKGGHVLDLGCGTGHYSRIMVQAGLVVDALDASQAMIEFASKVDGVQARLGRFEDLNTTDTYDGIWAYFSLLHARRNEMPDHLARISRALKPGGVFFLGLKRGEGHNRDHLDRYYEYYEQPELEQLLTEAGMKRRNVWFGKGAGLAGHPQGWIVVEALRAPS